MDLAEVRSRLAGERRALLVPVEMEQRSVDTSVERTLKGHAAVFDRLSEDLGGFREKVKRGAFRRVLDEVQDVRLLINHTGLPLARTKNNTLELREDPKGLRMYATLADIRSSEDLYNLVERGDIDQMSFGFTVASDEWVEKDGAIVRTITEIERLFDVSPVTFPAYPQTDVQVSREAGGVYIVRNVPRDDVFTLTEEDRAALIAELRGNESDAGAGEGAEEHDGAPPADTGDTPVPDSEPELTDNGERTARPAVASARLRVARRQLAIREAADI
jgi:HK97 family phage prohead protease